MHPTRTPLNSCCASSTHCNAHKSTLSKTQYVAVVVIRHPLILKLILKPSQDAQGPAREWIVPTVATVTVLAEEIKDSFWRIMADQALLFHRVRGSQDYIRNLDSEYRQEISKLEEIRLELQEKYEELKTKHRVEMAELVQKSTEEVAALQVRIRLSDMAMKREKVWVAKRPACRWRMEVLTVPVSCETRMKIVP